jgi:hypothetical protein
VGSTTKAPDNAFKMGRNIKFLVEAAARSANHRTGVANGCKRRGGSPLERMEWGSNEEFVLQFRRHLGYRL